MRTRLLALPLTLALLACGDATTGPRSSTSAPNPLAVTANGRAILETADLAADIDPVGVYAVPGATMAQPYRLIDDNIASTTPYHLRMDIVGGTFVVSADGTYLNNFMVRAESPYMRATEPWVDAGTWRVVGSQVTFTSFFGRPNELHHAVITPGAMVFVSDWVVVDRDLTTRLVRVSGAP